ncbi:hypothetical protein AXF42_Ash003264 [Apostasia shenzhenica]|uniref:RIN4 pathogenic type III effector avirulence factor Avr cleavage site domain-containing protein n=1 Tax=Apostasia shenzhenica TaxID=1088818 RepID=A0A2I0BFP3_9ASPA|nr:hypothetical protein AXF42_Ash003264 [Apostasia shenzhenica]
MNGLIHLVPLIEIYQGDDLVGQGTGRLSVPAFGEWDGKIGLPDYSVDFSRIREHRRQSKSRVSLGNEEELLFNSTTNVDHISVPLQSSRPLHQLHDSPKLSRKKIRRYFNCYGCLGAKKDSTCCSK